MEPTVKEEIKARLSDLDDAHSTIGRVHEELGNLTDDLTLHDKELGKEAMQIMLDIMEELKSASYYDPRDPRDQKLYDLVQQADRFIDKVASEGW